MKKVFYLVVLFAVSTVNAQDFGGVISSYLDMNRAEMGLQQQDIMDVTVNSHSFSNSMQLNTVYVSQNYQGIEIFNSVSSFAIKNSLVLNANLNFEASLTTKVNTTTPAISASTAVNKAATALGLPSPSDLELLNSSGHSYEFTNGGISLENIPVNLVFQRTENNNLRLAWDLSIYLLDASHYYNVRIDAITGTLLEKHDWVTSCDFGEAPHSHSGEMMDGSMSILFNKEATSNIEVNSLIGQYRVFPIPTESPNHGPEQLVADPSNAIASPFGWHDTDGSAGAEHTITRGNNVWAMEDINGNNGVGASPDGGASLDFDFPYDFVNHPNTMTDASTVNLFYMNNIMHDVWYQYGFDEASGNFQENNYGNGGNQGDSVNADAQDGSGTNNANFGTPPDGGNPRMQMFLWSPSALLETLTINNGPLAGGYIGLAANYGAPLPTNPLTEDLVLVEDDNSGASTDPNDACDPITNGGALSGKIAVIRRGSCEFGFKSLAAQNEGAVAVIIVNNIPGDPILMGGGAVGGSVTIPCLMVSQADGEAIITELAGATVNGTIQAVPLGPPIDGDLDNGVVAHEYGHGISNRLTGGPVNVSCLQNGEQMGEGWSDWFGLMVTIEPGDQGEDIRGIGTYDIGQTTTGTGIRTFPYSTDFAINPQTYADIIGCTFPHCVGEVWAGMLWEMTWDLIAQYGFDPDFYNGTGGNNIAMQLVMDGLKLQPCSPGFVTGRDAILMADQLSNGGANQCLIWDAFARRGLGLSATQGSPGNVNDGVEAFDVPTTPGCLLGTSDSKLDSNFIIYPNPSNGIINIRSLIEVGEVNILMLDLNGRQVYSETTALNDTKSIQVSHLKTGVYIVRIEGDNYVHNAKVIIK